MATVGLYFETKRIIIPQFGSWPMTIIRLMADVEFLLSNGSLTEPAEAIVDTGAPMSLLPRRLWRELNTEIHVPEATLSGISQRKVCQIGCSIGTVRGRLVDRKGERTRLYDFPAFLAKTNGVPLIIGFAKFLEKFKTCFEYEADEAWIEER